MLSDKAKEIMNKELLRISAPDSGQDLNLDSFFDPIRTRLKEEDATYTPGGLLDLFWEYMRSGLIAPGSSLDKPTLPFAHLTRRGWKFLKGEEFNPYDSDGYLKKLKAKVPLASDIVCIYVLQATKALQAPAYLAATVMIGAASEAAIWELAEAVDKYLDGDVSQPSYRKHVFPGRASPPRPNKWTPIKTVFGKVRVIVDKAIADKRLDRNLSEGTEVILNSTFWLIRNDRNEAGHPQGRTDISQNDIEGWLLLFPSYYDRIISLAEWLKSNHLSELLP